MFDWVLGEFDYRTQSKSIEVNRKIGVRLSSITERAIDHGGRMKFQLNSEITPGIHKRSRQFHFLLVVEKHREPLHLPAY